MTYVGALSLVWVVGTRYLIIVRGAIFREGVVGLALATRRTGLGLVGVDGGGEVRIYIVLMWEVYRIITPCYGLWDGVFELLIGLFSCLLFFVLESLLHRWSIMGSFKAHSYSHYQHHRRHNTVNSCGTEQLIYITGNII